MFSTKQILQFFCDFKITADVVLEIRQGKNMILCGVDWLIANESTSGIVIGKQFLSALGLNNRVLLAAAMSDIGEDVDISILYASSKVEMERDKDANKTSMVSTPGVMHGTDNDLGD
eukprot:gb/GEZJ01008899.1/.p2 GENE.gb/GEZJ01008899.1/~~gb/GEZJ01008899.1/.p2  ORF type:complete len:117 (-),score=19.04 gb/GEZJ01008899.1/:428-778(-)